MIPLTNFATCSTTDTNYVVVKVLAHSGYSKSIESDSSGNIVFLDRCSPPGKPIPVIMPPGNVIKLTWSKPEYNSHLVKNYCVKYRIPSQQSWIVNWTGNDIPEYVTNALEVGQCYIFTVMACDIDKKKVAVSTSEESDPISIDGTQINKTLNSCDHDLLAPGKPKVTYIDADDSEIIIEWKKPKVEAVCLKEYRVFACCMESTSINYSSHGSVTAKNRKAKVKQLQGGQQYRFKVVAVYEDKQCVESEESNIIKISEEISSPGKPVATNKTENSITLQWMPPKINLDLVKKYQVIYDGKVEKEINDINTCTPQLIIDQLSPFKGYVFKVVAICDDSLDINKESEESDPIFTKPGVPRKLECGMISHSEVNLSWQPPDNITQYCVYYNSPNDFGKVYTSNNKPQVSIPYLQPNTSYTFSVVSMCGDVCSDNSEVSEPINITTEPYQCSKPGVPCETDHDKNYDKIELHWKEPEDSKIVKSYSVTCFSMNAQIIRNVVCHKNSTNMITNLHPNTNYYFQVTANCKSGAFVTGPCSSIITTEKKVCSLPGVPTAAKMTHNSISLHWKKPEKNEKLVEKYIVSLAIDNQEFTQCCVTEDSKNEVTIANLAQNTGYYFRIVGDCNANTSKPSPISEVIHTKEACSEPGKPIVTKFTYDTISLEWTQPTSRPDIVQYYAVECCEHNDKNCKTTSNLTMITVNKLASNFSYTFQVTAHCGDDVDIVSEVSDSITTDKAICSAPHNPIVSKETLTEYSVVVQWGVPQKYNELIKGYIVQYQTQTGSWISVDSDITQTQCEITGLVADTAYKIKVQVQQNNNISTSETCHSETNVKTLPDVCSAPGVPRCTGSTYDSITLTWDEPHFHQHLVKSYHVTVFNDSSVQPKATPSIKPEIVFYDLKPNTAYRFKVTAKCKLNTSKESGWSDDTIKTKEEICSKPGTPTASSTSSNSVTLKWQKPAECAHLIIHYAIHYNFISNDYDGDWQAAKTFEVDEKKVIDQLQADTGYYFRVQAICSNNINQTSDCSEVIKTLKKKLAVELDLRSKLTIIPSNSKEHVCFQLDESQFMEMSIKNKTRMYTFGKPSKYPEKVLLLVGATGVGKSTLINGMVNYIFGVEWSDKYRLKLIHDETSLSQEHSQTQWISSYTFHWQEGFPFLYTLTVIDTPGFGDTEGVERDKYLTSRIKTFFELKFEDGGMEHVHGIGFLTQSSAVRLTERQEYIYNSMLSIFGKDVVDNIFIMATFSDGGTPQILSSLKTAGISTEEKLFSFNNASLFQLPEQSTVGDTFWLIGKESFKKFFTMLGETEKVSIQLSKEVLQEREKLEAIVSGLKPQVYDGLSKLDELAKTKCILKQYEDALKNDKNFEAEVEVTKYRPLPLPDGAHVTNCLQCNITCHWPCRIPNTSDKQNCYAMVPQGEATACCRICPKKCPWQQHENAKFRNEAYIVKEVMTSEKLKMQYTENVTGTELSFKQLDKEMNDIYQNIIKNIHDINTCLKIIREKALKADCVTDVEYINLLIESEKLKADKGYKERIEYLQQIQKDIKTFNVAKGFKPESMDRDQFFQKFREWKETQKIDEAETGAAP